jgi:hypothetical protein
LEEIVEDVVLNGEIDHRHFRPLYDYDGILQYNLRHLSRAAVRKRTIRATNSLSTKTAKEIETITEAAKARRLSFRSGRLTVT